MGKAWKLRRLESKKNGRAPISYFIPLTAGVWVSAFREFGIIGNGSIVREIQNCLEENAAQFDCTTIPDGECSHSDDVGIKCVGKHSHYRYGCDDALIF